MMLATLKFLMGAHPWAWALDIDDMGAVLVKQGSP